MDKAQFLQAANDERLKQNKSHLLRQAALVQFEMRTDDDYGTSRIVNALAEQVLAESALLALQHVGKALQGAVACAGYGASMPAVVEQCVNGFLQHALFVVDDDIGSLHVHETLQAVVAVDYAAVKVVQVGSRKPAAFERNERAQVRNDRQCFENHPFRARAAFDKALNELQTLCKLLFNLL